jgi:PDZ domain
MPEQPGQEVVLLGQVLADEATLGYEEVCNVQVRHLRCACMQATCCVSGI